MHRGAHYGATPAKKPRLDTLCFLFICPSARALLRVHRAHLLLNMYQTVLLRKCEYLPWPLGLLWRNQRNGDLWGMTLLFPGWMDGHHLSIGGDLWLNGGHLITLSRWPEIKNVLLCLWFCRNLKHGRAGNNSPPHACEKQHWRTRYSAIWMETVYSLAFMLITHINFVTELFPLSFLWTAASCGHYPEAQRGAKQQK